MSFRIKTTHKLLETTSKPKQESSQLFYDPKTYTTSTTSKATPPKGDVKQGLAIHTVNSCGPDHM